MAEIRAAFGIAVKFARQRKGWTQTDLATAAAVKQGYLSGIETGRRNPSLEVQQKLADALGLSLGELMTAVDEERRRRRRSRGPQGQEGLWDHERDHKR